MIASGTSTGYRFDDAGNLTWVKRGASTPETLTYDAASRLVSMSGAATTTLYTFDALGQRVAAGPASNRHAATFAYTGTGRLAAFDTSSGVSARYTFDASGQRTHSSVTSGAISTETTYTYDGLTLLSLAAQRSDGATWSITYLYDASSRPYAGIYRASESATPTLFALVTTDRGDVTLLLDAYATPLVSYRYDAFGRPSGTVTASGTLAAALAERQILRYATYAWDAESATYYCSARTYDPASAQFISKDPAKADGEESAYQYCGGDPVGKVDPSGLRAHTRLFDDTVSWNLDGKASYSVYVRVDVWRWWLCSQCHSGSGYSYRRGLVEGDSVSISVVVGVSRTPGGSGKSEIRVRAAVDKGTKSYWTRWGRRTGIRGSARLTVHRTYRRWTPTLVLIEGRRPGGGWSRILPVQTYLSRR